MVDAMKRLSVAKTQRQIEDRSKDVTRRLRWKSLKPGEQLQPIQKGMGLKKGEKAVTVGGPIEVVSVRREPLRAMITDKAYGDEEARREGFPELSGEQFAKWYAYEFGVSLDEEITRIEFRYL